MRNEKVGKITDFGDPNCRTEWAVLKNLLGGGEGGFLNPFPLRIVLMQNNNFIV